MSFSYFARGIDFPPRNPEIDGRFGHSAAS